MINKTENLTISKKKVLACWLCGTENKDNFIYYPKHDIKYCSVCGAILKENYKTFYNEYFKTEIIIIDSDLKQIEDLKQIDYNKTNSDGLKKRALKEVLNINKKRKPINNIFIDILVNE